MRVDDLERRWFRSVRKFKKHRRGSVMAWMALRASVAKGVIRLLWRLS